MPDLRVRWDIVIDDHIYRWNIKPSACHISADKNITFSSFKLIQGPKSL